MKLLTTFLAVLSLFVVYSTPATAQGDDCWHYEDGDAEIISTQPVTTTDLAVAGEYAYVMTSGGFSVYNITNPHNAQWVGGYSYSGGGFDWNSEAIAVHESGTCVYLAGSNLYPQGLGYLYYNHLLIIDVSDPANPGQVRDMSWITGNLKTANVAVSGDYLIHMPTRPSMIFYTFSVYDVSDPYNPVRTCSPPFFDGGGPASDAIIVGQYVYVAGQGKFFVFDIANPDVIVQVGFLALEQPGRSVAVAGNLAYVTDGDLLVIDVSDPTQPVLVGTEATPGASRGVIAGGGFVYVADGVSGIRVFEADPSCPFVGAMDTPGVACQITLGNDFAYVADGGGGLHTIWQQCPGPVGIEDDPEESNPDEEIPSTSLRLAVHPNPFNPQTTITFSLERDEWATVSVFELTGRRVALLTDRTFDAGMHSLTWSGRDAAGRSMPSGTYVVRLETESAVRAQKLMLIR